MATRVNTKFVVTLTAVLLVACAGVVGAFAFLLYNTGADLARMGDKQMALAKYKEAGDLYAKAVNKEPTNSEFLSKWIEALGKQTPQTPTRYFEAYRNLGNAKRQLAVVKRDEAAQRAYLEMEKQSLEMMPVKREALDGFVREADTLIAQHDQIKAEKLRRYRGLVKLRVAIEAQDVPPEYMDAARQDLEAALEADPDDSETARGLERYYAIKARRAEIATKDSDAKEAITKGDEIVSAFLAKHPDDAAVQLVALRRDWEAAQREVNKAGPGLDLKQKSEEFRARALPKLDSASAAAMATPADKIDRQLIGTIRQIEQVIDPPARQSRSEQLVRRALTARPQSAELLGTLADIQESREDHPSAVATLQQVVDMPDLPLSLEGAMLFQLRSEALMRQGLWTVKQWQMLAATPDKAVEAKATADKVRAIRAKLGEVEEAGSPGLTLLDAELAYIDQDDAKAARLLEQFNRTTNNASPDALMVGALVALRRNEPGQAAQLLRDLINLQRGNLRAMFLLATIDAVQLQNYEESKRLYEEILRAVPDNVQAKEGLKVVSAVLQGDKAKVDDPIVEAVLRADAMTRDVRSPDGAARAVALLREKIKELGADPRLVRQLVFAELHNNNNKAGAKEAVKQGLAANPDNKDLQMLDIRLSSTDELEGRLAIINQLNLPEPERLAERYLAYRQFNKPAEAQAELDKALKADPDSKTVLELVFMKSLEDKDFDKAKALTERAVKEDLDRCGGATYRARLESAMGRPAEAVRVMEEYVKGGGVQPESWRLLGRLQNQLGRHADAVKSFKAALALRPGDLPMIKDLLNTQVVMGASEAALGTARQNRQWAGGDDEFSNVWLSLEAQFGNRKMVIEQRERIARQDAEDRDNQMALAALYLDDNQPAKSRAIIDAVRAKKDGLDAVNLDAGWHWSNRDPAKARGVYDAYVETLTDKTVRLRALIAYAQFLGQRQDAPGALAVMEKARDYQTSAAEADKVIGDTYQGLGRPEEAIPAFKRVIDAGADTKEHTYLKRMVESMILLRKFADAEAALAPLLKDNPDAVVLLLASDLKAGQGDQRGQRQTLDRAVAQFPSEPMPFVKRAQTLVPSDGAEVFRLRDSKSEADKPKYLDIQRDLADAIKDLDRALELQPDLWVALRLRARAHELKGENDQSIADLRAALLANPSDQELLRGLINYMVQNGRENDATSLATELAQRRPGDPMIRVNIAGVFGGLNKWDAAARFMSEAFEIDQQDGIAQRYLDSLLSCTPPKLSEAEDVFKKLGDRAQANPGLLMAQAKLLMKQNQPGPAAQATAAALRLLKPDNPRDMIAWYNDLQKVEPTPTKQHNFLESLKSAGIDPGAVLWLNYFDGALMVQDPAGQQPGTALLGETLKKSTQPALRQMTSRVLGMALYGQKRFAEAEGVMQAALKEFPNDAENMNNLSYMLVKDLNKPAEALPLAESAAKLSPNSAEVLDTLGVVQQVNGQADKAVETLTKAQQLAQSSFAAATITIHLADALWDSGKKDEARKALAAAVELVNKQGGAASRQTQTELADLQKKITGSEGTK